MNYFIGEKRDDKYNVGHNPARIRIDSYNYLPIKKLTLWDVMILIKSAFNRIQTTTTIIYFLKKLCIKNPIHNIFN